MAYLSKPARSWSRYCTSSRKVPNLGLPAVSTPVAAAAAVAASLAHAYRQPRRSKVTMSMPSNSNPQPASAAQPADPSPVQPLRARAAVDLAPKESDDSFVGMTGGEIFHEMMLRKGVDVVFGYPGGAILPVYDAIYNSSYFDFVLPRHEQGAGHMAEGYARATGKPGIVLVTSGPGATNVVTPLQDALSDGVPMIVFSGQVVTSAIGTDAFQEADVVGITRSCTKWNVMVRDISELPRRINEAFEIATSGRPGPVLVDLPKDVTAGILNRPIPTTVALPQRPVLESIDGSHTSVERQLKLALDRAADLINNAKKPVLYVGQGMISHPDGPKLLKELADKGNIPVTTTLMGLGAFDETDPKSLHMLGMHGSAYANLAMQKADVIVALGARFDDRVTGNLRLFAPEAKRAAAEGRGGIIHFDILPKNINKTVNVDVAVEGDVVDNLRHLLPRIEYRERSVWFDRIDSWKQKYPFKYEPEASSTSLLKPQSVIVELNRQLEHRKADTIITTGVGQHQMWAAQYYRWRHPRTCITSGGLGTMGFGCPAAIGAKAGAPDKTVINIDGDGSFSMTAMEMATAAQYNIGAKMLVLNNNFQGMVRQWQALFYDKRFSHTPMTNPDFVKLAEALNCRGIRARNLEELPGAMEEFLAEPGPVLLEAVVDENEHVFPMCPAGKGLHEMVLAPGKVMQDE